METQENSPDKATQIVKEPGTINYRSKPIIIASISILIFVMSYITLGILDFTSRGEILYKGPKTLSETFYWEDDRSIEVDWNWIRTRAIRKSENDTDTTLCFLSGSIKNKGLKPIEVSSIGFVLKSTNGVTLFKMSTVVNETIEVNEKKEFDIDEYIPSGVVSELNRMSAYLSYQVK